MGTDSTVSQGQLDTAEKAINDKIDDVEATWIGRLDLLTGDLYKRVNTLSEQFAKIIGGLGVVAFLFSAGSGLLIYHVNFAVSTFQSTIETRDKIYEKDINELKKSLERIENSTNIAKLTETKIATNP